MYNVLPNEARKSIKRFYELRLTVIGLFSLSIVAVGASIFLLPAYFLSLAREEASSEQRAILAQLSASHSKNEFSSLIADTKEKIDALKQQTKQNYTPSVLIQKIIKIEGEGINISSFLYQQQGGKGSVVLSGIASSREQLLSFKERLQSIEPFERAELPVAILAKSKNLEFTLTLYGSF